MSEIVQDLRFGLRMLRKRAGSSALAILALGVGIGLTTTMFSIVQGVFLRGLPFDHSDRLLWIGRAGVNQASANSPPADDLADWRSSQHSFESLEAFQTESASLSGEFMAERARVARITPRMLHLLRVTPVAGRDFTDADAVPGAERVAIISYATWTDHFKRGGDAIGRSVRVDGIPTTIVGVAPPKFGFPSSQDLWLPLTITMPAKRGGGDRPDVIGRLVDGVSLEQASTEFTAISTRLAQQYPENKDTRAQIMPVVRRFIGAQVIDTLSAMLGAVFGVMLIACANVTNLQLARAAERGREVAVRAALGAGRARIVRQMLVEGLLLSAAGALLGLLIAQAGIAFFNDGIGDTNPPFWIDVRIDVTVLAFVTLLTVVATLAASLMPALRTTRLDLNTVLKDEGRANTGVRMGRLSRSLVVVEVLLSCCLLIVSGLMIKSVILVGQTTYPYATKDVFVAQIGPDQKRYAKDDDKRLLIARLEQELRAVPGVRAAAIATGGPQSPCCRGAVAVEGQTYAKPDDRLRVMNGPVTPSYFDVLRIQATRGRLFSDADGAGALPVAIVSEDFVAHAMPNLAPIGRRIKIGDDAKAEWLTIVGVVPQLVESVTSGSNGPQVTACVFVPMAQSPALYLTVLASTTGDPAAITGDVRQGVARIDRDMTVSNPDSLAGTYYRSSWAVRVFGGLFMSFGLAALVMASAGLYGVMAFSVRQRRQEIGVRMALGADRQGVARMVLWQGLWRVGLGIALGLGPAWLLGGLMKQLLYNVTASDPLVIVTTVITLLISGAAASLVPALRAASVDPLVALRHD